jgi:molybdenum cofactor synthesis domain-containing protein
MRPTVGPPPKARKSPPPAPKVHHDRSTPLAVEIVSIGRELLRGRVRDENAEYLSAVLSQRGAVVQRITTVDDRDRSITSAVREALVRGAQLIVTTGGLGPAADDRTLGAVADALNLPLAIHSHAKDMVEAAYRRLRERKLVGSTGLNAAREKMCNIPVSAEPVENEVGIAPGVVVRQAGGAVVLCLPGLPREMRSVFDAALPRLKDIPVKGIVAQREVESPTIDESSLRPLLDRLVEEFPSLWIKSYAPGVGRKDARILVTLEASASTQKEAESAVEGALRRLLALAGSG